MDSSLDLIGNEVVKNKTLEIVQNTLKTDKFSSHIERGSEVGDNYIGVIYRGKFKSLKDENDNKKSNKETPNAMDIIIKIPPTNKTRREQFFARPCFLREALVYDEIIPLFTRFQESKGIIPTEDGFYQFAESYGTLTEEYNEAIFMKDLKPEGFEMYNRHNYTTPDHIYLVMKILAKFHAIFYAMKDQCPEKVEKFMAIKDIFSTRKHDKDLLGYMNSLKIRALSTLCPDTEQHLIDKVEKLFEKDFFDLLSDSTNGKLAEPYATVCHGDCWNNNILYKNENGKPVDARLIDWQVCRYASPVCDLMYYIFLGSSQKTRKEHYYKFLDVYYKELSAFMRRLGSNPEKMFPRHAFDAQLMKFGHFGLLMGFMVNPIVTTHKEDVPDLDEMSKQISEGSIDVDTFKSERSEDAYRERTSTLIADIAEYGYI